jgi:hypothetical protein
MRCYRGAVLTVLLAAVPLAAAPPDDIILPVVPVAPPLPPTPSAATTLTGELLYVIQSKTECVVRAHPANLVRIEKVAGPITVRGKFVDGTGKTETRKFAGPWVYFIEAAGTGRVELDIIPLGLKAEADIVSVAIDVDVQGPIPPPKPKPEPDPKPDPKPDPAGPLRVIFVYESGALLTESQQAVMFGEKVRTYLDANSKGWRRYDKDVDATNEKNPDLRELWAAAKGKVTTVPCVIVASGSKAEILPIPSDPDAAVELLKKYAGGK